MEKRKRTLGRVGERPRWRNERSGNKLLIGEQSAVAEARGLYGMLSTGSTVEDLRALIAVPPSIERILRGFALDDPKDAHWIEGALKFREPVARKFERLVAWGVAIAEVPEP